MSKRKKAVSQLKSKKAGLGKKIGKKKRVPSVKKKVLAIPKGYHSITPYLMIENASGAIEFYKKVFGAKEVMRMEKPNGKIGHAELRIGDTKIMVADECPEMNAFGPKHYKGSPVGIHLYIKDVDNIVQKAVAAGAKIIRPVDNMFYGDRLGTVEDPFGHKWSVSTHIEDVSQAQMRKRAAAMMSTKQ